MAYRASNGGVRASVVRRRGRVRRVEESLSPRAEAVPLVVLESARLLLVHEASPFRAVLQEGLARAGFEVTLASDAKEALDALERSPAFDLALVDMDRYAPWSPRFIRALKTVDPGLYIAMLRGEGSREEFVEGYEAGASVLVGIQGSLSGFAEMLRTRLPEARRLREAAPSAPAEKPKRRFQPWAWAAAALLTGVFLGMIADAVVPSSRAEEGSLLDLLRAEAVSERETRHFQRWSVLEQLRLGQESHDLERLRWRDSR